MTDIGQEGHERISKAIAEAEGTTAGEIIAVTAEQSDSYHDVGLHYAIGATFLSLSIFTAWPELLERAWDMIAGWSEPPGLQQVLLLALGLALAVFLLVFYLMRYKPLLFALTPAATKTRRVRRRAILLFRAAAERRTIGRTGVLIYLSMGEHRAEIVGDEAITHATEPETWGEAMAALVSEVKEGRPVDGICAAIGQIGTVLAEHFPRAPDDENEIPDKLIEL